MYQLFFFFFFGLEGGFINSLNFIFTQQIYPEDPMFFFLTFKLFLDFIATAFSKLDTTNLHTKKKRFGKIFDFLILNKINK